MDEDKYQALYDQFIERIHVLNRTVWEERLRQPVLDKWLDNFDGLVANVKLERLHALYVIAHFMYFGSREIRVLLRAMYRDLYYSPLIQEIREENPEYTKAQMLERIRDELAATRFLGVGNPSESGVHLLYYFRQENLLPKTAFADVSSLIRRSRVNGVADVRLNEPGVRRYVFIDDVCGSGETAIDYMEGVLADIREVDVNTSFYYFSMFAAKRGIENVVAAGGYAQVSAIYVLDETYNFPGPDSRYLSYCPEGISPDLVRRLIEAYGLRLLPDHPFGYGGCGLMLGFHHNTPDNTLPIMWCDDLHGAGLAWAPAFKRYPKYGLIK